MRRLARGVTSAALVLVSAGSIAHAQALADPARASARGSISGAVVDDRGESVPNAVVSALGPTLVLAETDADGLFVLRDLHPSSYLLRAYVPGVGTSRSQVVTVKVNERSSSRLTLLRASETSVGTRGQAFPVLAAGMVGLETQPSEQPPDESASSTSSPSSHDHSDRAWRVRHVPRSVLKETSERILVEAASEADSVEMAGPLSVFGSIEAAGSLASGFFDAVDWTGEVNLLTTTSFDTPRELFTSDHLPRGIAYVSLGAPAGRNADWSVRGAMSQGDVSSWLVAGSYSNRSSRTHRFDLGMSYSTQRYEGGNPVALAAVSDGTRNVGEVHGVAQYQLNSEVGLTYGARVARYDYLLGGALFSPQLGLAVAITDNTRFRGALSQNLTAPGAEEFLPPPMPGMWLPPERTFSPLVPTQLLRPERIRHAEFALEHEGKGYGWAVRRFYQGIDDQLATLFGVRDPSGSSYDLGHYFIASPGSVAVDGWGVRLSCDVADRLRGNVDYSVTRARWDRSGDVALLAVWAPSAVRGDERFQDLTTSIETDIPETATRVFVLYRLNSAFAGSDLDSVPGLDARFDVRVHQSLPFLAFTNVDWELLVAVRNLFRETTPDGSAYDELLVVRPPKRIVGGLLVRF